MKIFTNEIKRLNNATRFSMQGFRAAWEGEAAFRFEVILASVMLPVAILIDVSSLERIALVSTVLLVLIVELLNSAIEAAIDRVGSEPHPLSGRAKDLGSAAVFVALLLTFFTWATVLLEFVSRHR
ncbi:diacylglycerol kinase [Proteobacteria bacterium 005FR1]|nr:diacylglycerol kinase [Proteobacteria bacterium 005FR1]